MSKKKKAQLDAYEDARLVQAIALKSFRGNFILETDTSYRFELVSGNIKRVIAVPIDKSWIVKRAIETAQDVIQIHKGYAKLLGLY